MSRVAALPLRERKKQEELLERTIEFQLTSRSKKLKADKREKRQKKKSVGELLCMLNYCGIHAKVLRPAYDYVPKSYNLDKQLVGLISHMFVQYPVPAFLLQSCLKDHDDPFKDRQEGYRQWFVTLAQGGSFSKLVKGTLTSKEACTFLSAPATNHIHENVWWAKMKVAGLPLPQIDKLIERIFSHFYFNDPEGRMAEVIQFYARFHSEMSKTTFAEITDFIAWKLQNDRSFRLKGRTITSMVKLTNQWHVQIQKAKLGIHVEWQGLQIPDWEFVAKNLIWTVMELRNNRELINEGRKQKHCVYSYVQWCKLGRSAIFSLRGTRKIVLGYTEEGKVIWDKSLEQTRITLEVNNQHAIVQIRGVLNRPATDEERGILRLWAGEKGIRIMG
jgi:hypothetical protein